MSEGEIIFDSGSVKFGGGCIDHAAGAGGISIAGDGTFCCDVQPLSAVINSSPQIINGLLLLCELLGVFSVEVSILFLSLLHTCNG